MGPFLRFCEGMEGSLALISLGRALKPGIQPYYHNFP
jgi:hypothetical protein